MRNLENNELQVIYDLEGLAENQRSELRNAGAPLTLAMRQLRVDLESELDSLAEEEKIIQRKQLYVKVAYCCFVAYTQYGALQFTDEAFDDTSALSGVLLSGKVIHQMFQVLDLDTWKRCIAKYGFEYIDHKTTYDCRVRFTLGIKSTPDEEDLDAAAGTVED